MTSANETYLKRFLKRFFTLELPLLFIVSALATLVPIVRWPYWLAIFLVGTAVVFALVRNEEKPPHISPEIILEDENEEAILEVPAPKDMYVQANRHARQVYGHDAIPLHKYEKWLARNPFITATLRTPSREYLGYFDVLPLTEEGIKLIESGLGEGEIDPRFILPPSKMKAAKKLYLAGIAVKESGTEVGKFRAATLILGLVSYLEYYYGERPRHVLAIAATTHGERLLKSIGARLVQSTEYRKDNHDLYEFITSPSLINNVVQRAKRRARRPKLSFKRPR